MSKLKFVLLVLVLTITFVGCGENEVLNDSDNLIIEKFEIAELVEVNEKTPVEITLNQDNNKSDYNWHSEKGEIKSSESEIFYLPKTTGQDTIKVTVTTKDGSKVTATQEIDIVQIISNNSENKSNQIGAEGHHDYSWFSLDYPEKIKAGQLFTFTGRATDDIAELTFKVDGSLIGKTKVDSNQDFIDFKTYNIFETAGEKELLVRAYNDNGRQVAAAIQTINILDENYPTQSYVEAELYFSCPYILNLKTETRKIKADENFKGLIEGLIAGTNNNDLIGTLPPESELLDLTMTPVANNSSKYNLIVDFNKEFVTKSFAGSSTAIITINSIINTLTQFDIIESAKILIEGEKDPNAFKGLLNQGYRSYNPEIVK